MSAPRLSDSGGRPRLLWAISHQTLVRAEVPILRRAGLDVAAEEPDPAVLRELDFVAYPDDVSDDGAEAVEVGRRLHLWSRDGRVTAAEADAVNESFDAVMVATRFDLAVEVRRWFRGTVCFRYLGSVPTIPGATSAPARPRDAEDIVLVPIFSTLAGSPLGGAFHEQFLVRTVVPDPPVQVTRGSGDAVGIYLAGLVPDDKWVAWAARIAETTDREVLAFGVPEDLHDVVSSNRVRCVPRLNDHDYWSAFASLSAFVYPHEDRFHSHYVPLEAIALGVPCVVSRAGVVAAEAQSAGIEAGERQGVFRNRQEIAEKLSSLTSSTRALADLAAAQRSLLAPWSPSAVESQAERLAEHIAVQRSAAQGGTNAANNARTNAVGIPSSRELRRQMRSGLPCGATVAAASIAAPAIVRQRWSADAVTDARTGLLSALRMRSSGDVLLKLGAPISHRPVALRVTVRWSGAQTLPAVIELAHGDNVRSRYELDDAVVTVDGDEVARVRVFGALCEPGTTVTQVSIAPASLQSASRTLASRLIRGETVPLWAIGSGEEVREGGLSFLTRVLGRSRLVVRADLDAMSTVSVADRSLRANALVVARFDDGGRPHVEAAVLLGRAWRRRGPGRDRTVLAVGSRRSLLGLRVTNQGRAQD